MLRAGGSSQNRSYDLKCRAELMLNHLTELCQQLVFVRHKPITSVCAAHVHHHRGLLDAASSNCSSQSGASCCQQPLWSEEATVGSTI